MPDFSYRAVDAAGRVSEGVLTSVTRERAVRELQDRGLTPVELTSAASAGQPSAVANASSKSADGAAPQRGRKRKLGQADVHDFTAEIAVMLRAGLPLDRALKVLIGMNGSPAFAALLADVHRSVKSGRAFSQALLPHKQLFGDFYINMVRSGEAGGQLADVLSRLAEHLERMKELRESVVSALIYPAILVVVAVLSVLMMLVFVVPQFEAIFEDMGDALPLPTRLVVAAGDLVGQWGWLMALVAVALGFGIRAWLATPAGRVWKDRALLRLPVFGHIIRKYETARLARSLGTLLGNGVPLVSALQVAGETMGNEELRGAMSSVLPAVKQGGRMGEAFAKTGLFTALGLNMITLGEETGRVDAMLLELARVYDNEVKSGIKRSLTMIEPVLILVLGVMIAAIIISILMGILSVNDLAT